VEIHYKIMKNLAWVLAIVIVLISFACGFYSSRILYKLGVLYSAFSNEEVRRHNIKVLEIGKTYVVFSNDPKKQVPKKHFIILNVVSMLTFVVVGGIMMVLLSRTMLSLTRKQPDLGSELRQIFRGFAGTSVPK